MGQSMDFAFYSKKSLNRFYFDILKDSSGCCLECRQERDKNEDRKTNREGTTAFQGRDDGALG